jgi:UDP-N-acetylmuramate--alanine ligase
MAGEHYRKNAFLVLNTLSLILNKTIEFLKSDVETFPGTQRRFEKIRNNLYSDYAHHPSEIKATIQLAQELNKNVVVVYQPHQNLRQTQTEIQEAYKTCFEGIDKVYWLPTYLSREPEGVTIISSEILTKDIKNSTILLSDLDSSLEQAIQKELDLGVLVLCMGAGSIDGWLREQFGS